MASAKRRESAGDGMNDLDPIRAPFRDWARNIETRLHLPKGFLFDLLDEGDWAFVIQSHVLLEMLMTELLVEVLGRDELRDFISSWSSTGRTGRIAALKALRRVSREESRFFAAFTMIRNSFVHNLAGIRATLAEHIEGMPKAKFDQLAGAISDFLGSAAKEELAEAGLNIETTLRENPQMLLWACVSLMASGLSLHHEVAKVERKQGPEFDAKFGALMKVLSEGRVP